MFTLADVFSAAHLPPPFGSETIKLRSAHFDSRNVGDGMLFVAMPGNRVDGNDYIRDAFSRGATAVLAERLEPTCRNSRQIIVSNALQTFRSLAHRIRERSSATVIGITGSNGKTSTKQALSAALNAHAPTLATDRSENADVGVPTTISRLSAEHRFAVVEMGAQVQGEIASHCRIAHPDMGVITNLSGAHIGEFGSMAAIVKAKSELIEALPATATTILPHEGPGVSDLRSSAPGRIVTFGRQSSADVKVSLSLTSTGSSVTIAIQNSELSVDVPGIAGPVDLAFGAAMAVTVALGLDPETSTRGLHAFKPAVHRMALRPTSRGITILDDSYNANAASMIEALRVLKQIPTRGQRFAVLGDMLELGPMSDREHRNIGRIAAKSDGLIAIGQMAELYAQGAIEAGMPTAKIHTFMPRTSKARHLVLARDRLEGFLQTNLKPGDTVLLKASNGIGLSHVADSLATADEY